MRVILHTDLDEDILPMAEIAFSALRDYPHQKKGDLIGFGFKDKFYSAYWNNKSITIRKSS